MKRHHRLGEVECPLPVTKKNSYMKKSSHILLTALLSAAFLFTSCTKDAGGEDIAPPVISGSDVFSFGFERQEATRTTHVYAAERGVNSVAIFIETVTGQFYKFLSTEAEGSPQAFKSVVKYAYDDGIEQYDLVAEVQLEMPYGAERFARVAVVANYAVLGNTYNPKYSDADFTNKLLAATSWNNLLAVQAPASQVNGVRLIPNLVSTRILDAAEVNNLWDTGAVGVLKLKRLAARITLRPSVWVDTGSGSPVEITNWKDLRDYYNPLLQFQTLSFYHPKSASRLFPDHVATDEITAIAQYERFQPLTYYSTSNDFYVYPMTGDEDEPLRLYVAYSVRPDNTAAWIYHIASIEIENPDAGKCLLESNHAYEVDFPFTFPVPVADIGDWNNGWTLTGRP